jgi:hypothetical protein
MKRFMAERQLHLPTCPLRDPMRWDVEDRMRGWADRTYLEDGEGYICQYCGEILEPSGAAPLRRPGRPPWTRELFAQRWREARAECGPDADDLTMATVGFHYVDARQLKRLIATFGRPE